VGRLRYREIVVKLNAHDACQMERPHGFATLEGAVPATTSVLDLPARQDLEIIHYQKSRQKQREA